MTASSGTTAPVVRRGVSLGPVGLRVTRRATIATTAATAAVVALALIALLTGTLDVAPDRVLAALRGEGTRVEDLVVVDTRLARTVAAVLVGFALGVSGALTQSVTRNPIATPDILGVTAGASLCAVLLVTRPEVADRYDSPAATLVAPAAMAGGLLATAVILTLSWRAGFDGLRLVLVGLGVNALCFAGISWLLTRAGLEEAAAATRWLTGSLEGASPGDLPLLGALVLVAGVACLVLSRGLAALRLGREVAPTLGTSPPRAEAVSLLVAVLLVSAATAVAGPVGFVAFVAPQAAMRLFGTAGPPPLAGGLLGAVLVLGADLVAQRLPAELPVGVLTAVVGAPYLLHLLLRHARRDSA